MPLSFLLWGLEFQEKHSDERASVFFCGRKFSRLLGLAVQPALVLCVLTRWNSRRKPLGEFYVYAPGVGEKRYSQA